MTDQFDILIAGAGLSGASSALAMAKAGYSVGLIDQGSFASGASGSGMALVSPMMSRKGRPVWRVREALDTLGLADTGLLRPASSPEQAAYFEQSTHMSPDLGVWLTGAEAREHFPYVIAPHGLVHVLRGYSADLATLTRSWIDEAIQHGAEAHEHVGVASWEEHKDHVEALLTTGKTVRAGRLLLATGPELVDHPRTNILNLHPIKGQRIRVRKPDSWNYSILPLSGAGYILDDGDCLSIGATFEHEWTAEGPTPEGRHELLAQAAKMMPEVQDMEVVDHSAAIRVTVPGTRMPMIGPLPDSTRTWVFTGLGSKGILMAGLLGMKIPDFFNDLEAVPASCRVAIRKAID
jgi:glycine/D-amino acid oxidase-like deaminating enzyme